MTEGVLHLDKISVVIPCFNEAKVLSLFYREMEKVMKRMNEVDFELIFVDDGSKDNTLGLIKKYQEKDKRVHYLAFSRNFGKEAAILAGLKFSAGNYIVLMDADLQDPPYLLDKMYSLLKGEDCDSVATRRVNRQGEPKVRSFFARRFYRLMNRISKTNIIDGARDFRMMKRQMVDAILNMGEYNRFSKGIFGWVGFRTKWMSYNNIKRAAGESKWSFWKLLLYSFEGITAFSTLPFAFASFVGIFLCIVSFISIFIIVFRKLCGAKSAFGWTSMTCIILFLSGIQLFSMGILGQYLSKTYLEVKKRPIYIIKEQG
ncbi:glucosyl transferase family 2 [Anaerocolumna cellulosilytica]|uniref:Glucosyl transferase family 2 n=1 Tax=Anaerocolumna cellulosilytica TaxID=433286 RepID=A0A6S6R372_9FIRM|nr:glycosyltransferase family 2 protein [Anaerocolumna cellulosilytica]MBB5196819.1 glycosyltransferase involved in cell wall biosynthesis [Anaerocolumna cellulosilytica]BCJ95789.1 glucosyl transferase family 2 [Anaerocolumna cellulosilytica]